MRTEAFSRFRFRAAFGNVTEVVMKKSFLIPVALVLSPQLAWAQAEPTLTLDLGGAEIAFVRIPEGRFAMGSPATEAGRKDDEKPHQVLLSSGFYMAKAPVTVGAWKRFVEATAYQSEAEKGTSGGFGWDGQALVQKPIYNWKNPGFAQTDDHPVTIITYDDALEFTRWATRASHRSVTLPTEAQWEYAYRAGTTSAYYDAKAKDALGLGWFKQNAGAGTKPVGQKKPNAWGLVDMGGNVWQWCLDWYAPYADGEVSDPKQNVADTSDKARRVLRGGSWLKDALNGRAAARYRSTPGTRNADNGFRLVVLDQAPIAEVLPQKQPAPETTEPNSSPMPSDTGTSSSSPSFVNLLLRFGPVAFVVAIFAWMFTKRGKNKMGSTGVASGFSASGIALRPGKDGFWIDANEDQVGARITVNYRSMGQDRVTYATVERAGSRQFVYTGYEPELLRVVEVVPAAQPYRTGGVGYQSTRSQASSWNSSSDDDSDSSSSNNSFQGYPPAY